LSRSCRCYDYVSNTFRLAARVLWACVLTRPPLLSAETIVGATQLLFCSGPSTMPCARRRPEAEAVGQGIFRQKKPSRGSTQGRAPACAARPASATCASSARSPCR
jgi:hypothetical protein